MNRKTLLSAAIFTLVATSPNASVLDQYQLSESGGVAFWSDYLQAQSFTAGITGRLDSLEMALSETPASFNELIHVSVVEWSGSSAGSVLGTHDVFMDDYTGAIDFSAQNIQLTSGSTYAFILSNDLSYYNVNDPYRNTGIRVLWDVDGYADGSLWTSYDGGTNWTIREGTDTLFATYMSPVPVPAAVWLFGSGLIGLIGLSRRRT